MNTGKGWDSEVLQAFLHDYPDEEGWVDAGDEHPYPVESVLKMADWLVVNGYAEPGYAETLRRALMRGLEGGGTR